MELTVTPVPPATVVALAGRLDGLASPTLERHVENLLAAGSTRLIFDLARLDYASSAGLRVFLSSAKRCQAAGGSAVFAALSPAVREVFELSGFLGVFSVYPTARDAAAAFA